MPGSKNLHAPAALRAKAQLSIVVSPERTEAFRSLTERIAGLNRISKSEFSRQVFNRSWSHVDWGVPSGLAEFASRLGEFISLGDPQHWLSEHTLAPFWSSLMEPTARGSYMSRCISAKPGPRRPLLPVSAVEWVATRPVLCPTCDDEHVARLGFSYVDRGWLLPFLTRCSVDGDRLAVFPHWRPYSRGNPEAISAYPGRANQGCELAASGLRLLNQEEELLPQLGTLLQSRGYTTRSGSVRRKAVADLLLRHASGRYEHPALDRLLSSPRSVMRVLAPLGAARGCLHPFVGTALVSALRDEPVVQEALALADDRDSRALSALQALKDGANLTAASRAAGVCVTTVTVLALAHGMDVDLRPSMLKPELRQKLEALLISGIPVAKAAVQAGLSASTAYRVLRSNPAVTTARKQVVAHGRLEQSRLEWLAHAAAHPDCGVAALRNREAGIYAFLYRVDRQWLQAHNPPRKAPSGNGPRSSRAPLGADELLALRIQGQVQSDEHGSSPLASRRRMATLAGRGRFRVSSASTPKGAKALDQAAESSHAYVWRRLSQATAELRNLGIPLMAWRVVRQSRLRESTIEAAGVDVRQVIQATRAAALRRPRNGYSSSPPHRLSAKGSR
jgi:hypothetical protein